MSIGFALLILGIMLPLLTFAVVNHLLSADLEQHDAPNQDLMLIGYLVIRLVVTIGIVSSITGLTVIILAGIRSVRRM